jgi:RHS repeat-associated protein
LPAFPHFKQLVPRSFTNEYTFDYYANGWLKSSDDGTSRIEYLYDAAGRRDLVTVKQGGTTLQSLDYVYNATSKRLENIVSAAGTFTFGYDAWGRRGSLLYPNGVNAVYSYHGDMDWLTGIDYQGLGLTIGYPQHDKVGNRRQRSEAVAPEDAVATDYAYDDTYQLIQAKTGAGEENYVYDKVGNRQSGPTVKDTAAAAYDHDAANRMLQGRKFTYAYDARGNQSRKYLSADQTKRWEFTWDGENRLREAKLIADAATLRTVTFKYDPFGRRVRKQVQGLAPHVPFPLTTTYTYDGEDIVLQLESNGTTATTTKYVHGPGIDEPLAMLRGGASFFYHADGLGSVVAVSNGSKSIVARYGYDAFGMVSASDPEFANFCTYTGREWDKEIGLYYYRARFYDPMEGRFISRDPIGFSGGDWNLYSYVQNNASNLFDPFGLAPMVDPNDPFNPKYEDLKHFNERLKDIYKKKGRRELIRKVEKGVSKALLTKSLKLIGVPIISILSEVIKPDELDSGEDELLKLYYDELRKRRERPCP